jgi:hypothetical protein
MKSLPPDRSEVVKELEQRLVKKWKAQQIDKGNPGEKPGVPTKISKEKKKSAQ